MTTVDTVLATTCDESAGGRGSPLMHTINNHAFENVRRGRPSSTSNQDCSQVRALGWKVFYYNFFILLFGVLAALLFLWAAQGL